MKHTITFSILFLTLICVTFTSFGQKEKKDFTSDPQILLGVHYGGAWSDADLKERYGYFNQVGLAGGYKFKNNWYVGVNGDFMFGNKVKITRQELFHSLVDSKGNFTDQNGDIGTVLTFARGVHAEVEAGRVINQWGHNKNSGVFLKFGLGYMNHRIRIESSDHVIPLIEKEYRKGYDRLTTGVNLTQFIGYLFTSDNGWLNFYGGLYINEGLTKNRRPLFWDQPNVPVPTKTRFDLLYGFKVGWLIPVSKRVAKEYYYN